MTDATEPVETAEIVAPVSLTDLCQISGTSADWVIELVEEGILEPVGPDRTAWRFESSSIAVIRRVRRIQNELRVNLPGIALVLSLAEENSRLKRRLQRMDGDP